MVYINLRKRYNTQISSKKDDKVKGAGMTDFKSNAIEDKNLENLKSAFDKLNLNNKNNKKKKMEYIYFDV